MSSDGATDKPRSARPARGEDRGVAQIALVILLVLALVATIVMIFSDNPVWMRIGTLAALWAAFIGAFLVGRYRRQAASEASRVRDLHTVYELQLEREISARREHELVVEKDLRDSIRAETSDSILALRHEIAALREQLGQLGVTLPEDRFAVGAHAPAGELGSGSPLPNVPSERVEPRRRAPEQQAPEQQAPEQQDSEQQDAGQQDSERQDSGAGYFAKPGGEGSTAAAPATGVGRDSTPSTERTEKIAPVRTEQPAASSQTPWGQQVSSTDQPRRPAVKPATGRRQQVPEQDSQPAAKPEPATAAKPEPAAAKPKPSAAQPPEPEAPHSRHGSGSGLSVAELMARLGGDSDGSSGGRRHRRAED